MEQKAKEDEIVFEQKETGSEEQQAQGRQWQEDVCEWGRFLGGVWFCVNSATLKVNLIP